MRVELVNLRKVYKGRVVLDLEGLVFESGKIYSVLGPNGSGKSTLLRLMGGMETPDGGKVIFDGKDEAPCADLAYLPQNPYIFDMTVLKNVMLGLGSRKNVYPQAEAALEYVGLSDFSDRRALSLSGGEAQRMNAARTLVLGRKLVLLDEPASSVDISSMRLVESYIVESSRKNGSTVVFSTHNPSQAFRIADEVIVLQNGKVAEKGECRKVLKSPAARETKEFLDYWGGFSEI